MNPVLDLIPLTMLAVVLMAVGIFTLRRGRPCPAPPTSAPPPAAPELASFAVPAIGPIAPLARLLDGTRRLNAAEARVERALTSPTPPDWMVERNVILGPQRIPFVLIGPCGLFTLCATDGGWAMSDFEELVEAGEHLRSTLPGYEGPVTAVICFAYDSCEPHSWFGPTLGPRAGWMVGVDQLWAWLGELPSSAISPADVSQLHAAAGPHWARRCARRLPAVRNVG